MQNDTITITIAVPQDSKLSRVKVILETWPANEPVREEVADSRIDDPINMPPNVLKERMVFDKDAASSAIDAALRDMNPIDFTKEF